jgi:hypothetical protein
MTAHGRWNAEQSGLPGEEVELLTFGTASISGGS